MKKIELSRVNELFKELISFSNLGEEIAANEIEKDYETVIERVHRTREGLYVKVESFLDSYGENERVRSIQFVEPKVKTITDFEIVK